MGSYSAPLVNNGHPNELLDAQAHIWNHIFSYHNSMALKCVLELGIPDAIHKHGNPITLPQLATALNIHPSKVSSLNRLMRLLVHSNFFSSKLINGEFMFYLTLNSKLLLKDHPLSLAPFAAAGLDPILMGAANGTSISLKNGSGSPFHVVHGRSIWDHAGIVPEFNELFNNCMASDARFVAELLTTNEKFEGLLKGVKSLVDVGGGDGTMAKAIVEAYPEIKCIVLELPHVVEGLQGNGLNLEHIGGDMFEQVPPAQVALLKRNKKASGLWGVQFPYLDDLDKIYGTNRATGTAVENFEDAVNHLEGEPVNLDMDDDDEEDDESIQSTQPSPRIAKKARKEPSSKGKGKKRVAEDKPS